MELQYATGKTDIYSEKFVFIGPPKFGKTTTASGFPDNTFIVHDPVEIQKLQVPYLHVQNWTDVLLATDEMIRNKRKHKMKFLTFDYIDVFHAHCEEYICGKGSVEYLGDFGHGKGWDQAKTEFKKWLYRLFSSGYGLIFITHTQTRELMTRNGVITKTTCTLNDRAAGMLFPLVSVIGSMEAHTKKVTDQLSKKIKYINERRINFEQTEYILAGDRTGALPSSITMYSDPRKTFELIKSYYDGTRMKGGTI